MSGFIGLYRSIQNHWLWQDKPYSKGQAWIDILLMVNHKKRKIVLGNELIEVDRGERITSERKLSERWGWSRTKVRGFLELLEQDKMIVLKKDTKKTTLKVLNYGDYQNFKNHKKTAKEPQKDHGRTTEEPQKNTNNNDNNDNNVKNDNNKDIVPEDEIKKIYNSISDYWLGIFKDYIDNYRLENQSKKITTNKHLRLLKEIHNIFKSMKFNYSSREYNLTEKIFDHGMNVVIEKRVANLNYAKQVWISDIQKGGTSSGKQISKDNEREDKRQTEENDIFNTG